MKIHRLFPLLVALVGLSGCPNEEPCFGSGVVSGQIQPGMILVGEETTLRIAPNIVSGCGPEEAPTPTSLTVEVYDPDNLPVEHDSRLGTPTTASNTIRFTARKPGRHHVFVAFDPVGGIHQFDIYAAMDHSKETTALTVQQQCTALERTQKGALVCDQDVIRNGTHVQRFANSLLAVAGDAVWVVNTSGIQRYVDTGSAFTLAQSLGDIHGTPLFLHATENELVVLYPSIVKLITVSGTGLFSTGTALWTPSTTPISTPGPQALAVRAGERLGIVTRASAGTTQTPSYQVCPHRLENGRFVRTTEPCSSFRGVLVGYEPNALWVGDPQTFTETDFTSLRYLQWTGTGLMEQASLPLGFNLKLRTRPFYSRQTAVPTIAAPASAVSPRALTTVAVYSADRRTVLLEYLGADLFEPSASQRLLWASQPAGTPSGVTVRVRPSAP
jgi:hypothetical protein